MEKLLEMGLARNIGTSNITIPKLELLLKDVRVRPACNEMELHPHFQQLEFLKYLLEQEIQPIGFSPLGSPARPKRDRIQSDTSPLEDPAIRAIAREHGIHPAEVCLNGGTTSRGCHSVLNQSAQLHGKLASCRGRFAQSIGNGKNCSGRS